MGILLSRRNCASVLKLEEELKATDRIQFQQRSFCLTLMRRKLGGDSRPTVVLHQQQTKQTSVWTVTCWGFSNNQRHFCSFLVISDANERNNQETDSTFMVWSLQTKLIVFIQNQKLLNTVSSYCVFSDFPKSFRGFLLILLFFFL